MASSTAGHPRRMGGGGLPPSLLISLWCRPAVNVTGSGCPVNVTYGVNHHSKARYIASAGLLAAVNATQCHWDPMCG